MNFKITDIKELDEKYNITKTDGTPVDPNADYFVLRLDTDINARKALLRYADYIRDENPELSLKLQAKIVIDYDYDEFEDL